MKELIVSTFIVLGTLDASAAAVSKICFHVDDGGNGIKGDRMVAQLTTTRLIVNNLKGEGAWEGDFKRKSQSLPLKGKDGRTYLQFWTNGDEGCTEILVDKNLTTAEGTGQIKFRCRGEGFSDTKFFCRNNQ